VLTTCLLYFGEIARKRAIEVARLADAERKRKRSASVAPPIALPRTISEDRMELDVSMLEEVGEAGRAAAPEVAPASPAPASPAPETPAPETPADDDDIDEEAMRAAGLLPGEPPSSGNSDPFADAYQAIEVSANASGDDAEATSDSE